MTKSWLQLSATKRFPLKILNATSKQACLFLKIRLEKLILNKRKDRLGHSKILSKLIKSGFLEKMANKTSSSIAKKLRSRLKMVQLSLICQKNIR